MLAPAVWRRVCASCPSLLPTRSWLLPACKTLFQQRSPAAQRWQHQPASPPPDRDFHAHHRVPYSFPRDLTIPQFILDSDTHPLRPSRLANTPWLVDDETGRSYGLEEIRERVERLARGIKQRWSVERGDVACLYSANHLDYPIVIWALHRLGAIVS